MHGNVVNKHRQGVSLGIGVLVVWSLAVLCCVVVSPQVTILGAKENPCLTRCSIVL